MTAAERQRRRRAGLKQGAAPKPDPAPATKKPADETEALRQQLAEANRKIAELEARQRQQLAQCEAQVAALRRQAAEATRPVMPVDEAIAKLTAQLNRARQDARDARARARASGSRTAAVVSYQSALMPTGMRAGLVGRPRAKSKT